MAGIKDILEIEQSRDDIQDWQVIHLFQEGSFYRAYEVSAWLCTRHISEFKVTHRHVKGIDSSIAFVGFPVSSLAKRTPAAATVEELEDKHVVMKLSMAAEPVEVKELKNDYAVWKSRQPITESKENMDGNDTAHGKEKCHSSSPTTLFSVAQRILAYPIESHSPIESMLFLAEVKKDLAAIL